MENPYQTPNYSTGPGYFSDGAFVPAHDPGLIGHVRVVAILGMIQGVLALPMGAMYIFFGVMMPEMIKNDPQFQNRPLPAGEQWGVLAVFLGMGLPTLLTGLLLIFTGWRCYGFRNRRLVIIGYILSLGGVSSCYCAPTAIGLAIYGLVVMLNQSVTEAFAMRERGATIDQIFARFYSPRG